MRTLTDRYVHAVVRRVPDAMRPEVTADVTAMIADMTEARMADARMTEARHDEIAAATEADVEAAVEIAVLEELGDPAVLAREYSDSPQHLIGPQYFPVYTWLLTWVLPVALVAALVSNGLSYTLSTADAHIGGLLGTAIGKSIPAVFIAFAAVTILFAIIERATPMGTQAGTDNAAEQVGEKLRPVAARRPRWTVDSLKEVPPGGTSVRADAILSLVFLVLLALVPFVPTTAVYVGHLNDGETFINPDLGLFWLIGYWVLLAVTAVGAVLRIRRRRLSTGLVALDMITDLVMAVFLTIALLTQDVLHPAIEALTSLPVELWAIPLIWAITIWDQVSTVRGYRTHLAAHGRS
ncbi:hypothetical protein [Brevibacterium yomogidense]|uniref:Membrane protein, putative n=1 Tax=Brevibacterium yomogidense TaxID=946573 RepID=A0A1X6XLL9_9MICO|nr:hypothetical protein [Brevibacterium yomogidense]SLM99417.1 membrane protein, putative [Brevibacterium yomogidense]